MTARNCPPVSVRRSPSPAACTRTPPSCCWTNRPPPWTATPNTRCTGRPCQTTPRPDQIAGLISHRMASVVACDRIVIFDGGRITESGTHQEPMDLGAQYAAMFTLMPLATAPRPGKRRDARQRTSPSRPRAVGRMAEELRLPPLRHQQPLCARTVSPPTTSTGPSWSGAGR